MNYDGCKNVHIGLYKDAFAPSLSQLQVILILSMSEKKISDEAIRLLVSHLLSQMENKPDPVPLCPLGHDNLRTAMFLYGGLRKFVLVPGQGVMVKFRVYNKVFHPREMPHSVDDSFTELDTNSDSEDDFGLRRLFSSRANNSQKETLQVQSEQVANIAAGSSSPGIGSSQNEGAAPSASPSFPSGYLPLRDEDYCLGFWDEIAKSESIERDSGPYRFFKAIFHAVVDEEEDERASTEDEMAHKKKWYLRPYGKRIKIPIFVNNSFISGVLLLRVCKAHQYAEIRFLLGLIICQLIMLLASNKIAGSGRKIARFKLRCLSKERETKRIQRKQENLLRTFDVILAKTLLGTDRSLCITEHLLHYHNLPERLVNDFVFAMKLATGYASMVVEAILEPLSGYILCWQHEICDSLHEQDIFLGTMWLLYYAVDQHYSFTPVLLELITVPIINIIIFLERRRAQEAKELKWSSELRREAATFGSGLVAFMVSYGIFKFVLGGSILMWFILICFPWFWVMIVAAVTEFSVEPSTSML